MNRVAAVLLIALVGASCGRSSTETRTIVLRHMDTETAVLMVEPYLQGGGVSYRRTERPPAVTITASPERLDQVEELLRRFDVPAPGVMLHFQLIEADGFTGSDPAIADVEASLRELFRFRGYRLVAEAMVRSSARTNVNQALIGPGDRRMSLSVDLGDIIADDQRRAVELHVALAMDEVGEVMSTGVTLPDGQQVVLGSSRPIAGLGALILVVKPQIE